jgi:hypothetical protein
MTESWKEMKIAIRDVKGCFFCFTARQLLVRALLLVDKIDKCEGFVTHLFPFLVSNTREHQFQNVVVFFFCGAVI